MSKREEKSLRLIAILLRLHYTKVMIVAKGIQLERFLEFGAKIERIDERSRKGMKVDRIKI